MQNSVPNAELCYPQQDSYEPKHMTSTFSSLNKESIEGIKNTLNFIIHEVSLYRNRSGSSGQ